MKVGRLNTRTGIDTRVPDSCAPRTLTRERNFAGRRPLRIGYFRLFDNDSGIDPVWSKYGYVHLLRSAASVSRKELDQMKKSPVAETVFVASAERLMREISWQPEDPVYAYPVRAILCHSEFWKTAVDLLLPRLDLISAGCLATITGSMREPAMNCSGSSTASRYTASCSSPVQPRTVHISRLRCGTPGHEWQTTLLMPAPRRARYSSPAWMAASSPHTRPTRCSAMSTSDSMNGDRSQCWGWERRHLPFGTS
jgi:hypothetical protein